ncbi:class I SAM-dependent methyltransferase [Helicobacter pullorum]|uniref:class I SAM-dependent methyltransferase n=1 Tax=Helicobacter pullorum TaxID=35818 RepID=UPI00241C9764|nr:methyltransferase domain-containing protein [Helicobacter pullorum]
MIQLNLGCWHRNIPGFINVDLCDMPHIHYKTSIDKLDMFKDESVDLIYSSHSFEYFDRFKAADVLKEWRRVLKKGGILRIAVPDFDKLIQVYKKSDDLSKILGPLYGRMEIDTANGKEYLYHKTVYNFQSLSKLLTDNGFDNVKKYDWRDTIHKNYDDHSQAYYPHMDKENGILISLNVEAVKNV